MGFPQVRQRRWVRGSSAVPPLPRRRSPSLTLVLSRQERPFPEGLTLFGLTQAAVALTPLPPPAQASPNAASHGLGAAMLRERRDARPELREYLLTTSTTFQTAAAQTPPKLYTSFVNGLLSWCSDCESQWLATQTAIAGKE